MKKKIDKFPENRWPAWTRTASLIMAAATCLTLLIYPHVIGHQLTAIDHSILPVFLIAASACFTFGLGFRFKSSLIARLASPTLIWPILTISFFTMIYY